LISTNFKLTLRSRNRRLIGKSIANGEQLPSRSHTWEVVIAGELAVRRIFAIFASFAGIIGQQFFPTASLMSVYGLFAVAFVVRPLGGIVLGGWADRVGRKRALVTIVLTMAFGTAVIGLLTTHYPIVLFVGALQAWGRARQRTTRSA
jgi:MHS family proline/betaine transporter-like MFS transporter